jgi:molybdopterin-guanine dinucleotide biosynthesis protein A
MGMDKARLRLGGKTFLTHIRSTAKQAGLPVRVIRRDLVPGCGPLGGVYTALRTSRAEAIVFLSCDMPLLTSSILSRVQAAFVAGQAAVFVQHAEIGFPFVIRCAALPVVEARLAAKTLSLRSLANALHASLLKVSTTEEAQALTNVNTPAELKVAREIWRQKG